MPFLELFFDTAHSNSNKHKNLHGAHWVMQIISGAEEAWLSTQLIHGTKMIS